MRKNAIKFLTSCMDSHPFEMDERKLDRRVFVKKQKELETLLKAAIPTTEDEAAEPEAMDTQETQEDLTESPMEIDQVAPAAEPASSENPFMKEGPTGIPLLDGATANPEGITKLQLIHKYYEDALRFVNLLESAVPTVCALLASTTKAECVEAMEFFRTMKHYRMEGSEEGIRRMVHLVWNRDAANEDGKGVRDYLIDTYQKLFFEGDVAVTAKNLISYALIPFSHSTSIFQGNLDNIN